jgi:hypothetical protein
MLGWRKRERKLYEVAQGIVDGKEITYSFTRPLPEDEATEEFRKAADKGLPSGSVIIIA